jgi:hypothetical protein
MKRAAFGVAALAVTLAPGCETAIDMAVGSQIDGTWKGKSYCAQGLPINTTLDVSVAGSVAQGKIVVAVPKGNLDAPGPDAVLASYSLQGTFDAPNLHLVLQPAAWIEGVSPTRDMQPVDATLRTDGRTLEIKQGRGCTENLLTKQ